MAARKKKATKKKIPKPLSTVGMFRLDGKRVRPRTSVSTADRANASNSNILRAIGSIGTRGESSGFGDITGMQQDRHNTQKRREARGGKSPKASMKSSFPFGATGRTRRGAR
jgi:hypothetical protein